VDESSADKGVIAFEANDSTGLFFFYNLGTVPSTYTLDTLRDMTLKSWRSQCASDPDCIRVIEPVILSGTDQINGVSYANLVADVEYDGGTLRRGSEDGLIGRTWVSADMVALSGNFSDVLADYFQPMFKSIRFAGMP
jgi:hypothetical protein